ncbi:MAG: hypothetical protein ACLP8S_31800 [Solirubrobacteraceae bacterium]
MRVRVIGLCALGVAALLSGCGGSGAVTRTSTILAPRVVVKITSPANGASVGSENVTVTGTVDPAGASVNVNGDEAAVNGRTFVRRVSVPATGQSTIEAIATAPERSPGAAAILVSSAANGGSAGGGSAGGGASAPSGGVPTDSTSCGGGLSVGPSTGCAFARNVQAAYMGHGAGTYPVYSPVTKRLYAMTCTAATVLVTCQGANSAYVYFVR